MKLRRISTIVTDAKLLPCSKAELLAFANLYGYLLPGGGTPWDAETMTVRTLGPGKGSTDFIAGFDPADTFETPVSPGRRLTTSIRRHWPVVDEDAGRVVWATVGEGERAATVEIAVERTAGGNATYRVFADGRAVESIGKGQGWALEKAEVETTRLAERLEGVA